MRRDECEWVWVIFCVLFWFLSFFCFLFLIFCLFVLFCFIFCFSCFLFFLVFVLFFVFLCLFCFCCFLSFLFFLCFFFFCLFLLFFSFFFCIFCLFMKPQMPLLWSSIKGIWCPSWMSCWDHMQLSPTMTCCYWHCWSWACPPLSATLQSIVLTDDSGSGVELRP